LLEFGWVAGRREPPERWDLRRAGWRLVEGGEPRSERTAYPLLVDSGIACGCLAALVGPEWIIALGVGSGDERARLIGQGFGDALSPGVNLPELCARTRRATIAASKVASRLQVGQVTLDLCHRDAMIAGNWVGLHPREFELLWRLAANHGGRVTRRQLLKDVWRLDHDPETNSVEVHVSRLRSKLALMGIANLVTTDPQGGYRINWPADDFPEPGRDVALLDTYTR
jgi:DNA-binding winged helix-turn-helix (wHTH) protein